MSADTLISLLGRLWTFIDRRRKRQFYLLVVLGVASAVAEVISIGSVLPFLMVLTAPERVLEYEAVRRMAQMLGIEGSSDLVLPLTVLFCGAVLLAGATRLLLLWGTTRLTVSIGTDLSQEVYRRTLFQPYSVHIARNSSEIISGIVNKVSGVVGGVLFPVMTLFSSAVLLIAIMVALIGIQPFVAISAILGFGLSYGLISLAVRYRLRLNSDLIAREQTQVIKALQEGLGGIRDVLLDGTQDVYSAIYQKADRPLREASGSNYFLSGSPRFVMEAIGTVLIAGAAFYLSGRPGGVSTALPVLGALALGAQRLLPALQQGFGAWASIAGNHGSLAATVELLEQPLPANATISVSEPLRLREAIRFEGIGFRYGATSAPVLENVNLVIPKGSRIGFVGATGSGKSTVMDLIMGLLEPTEGAILADGLPIAGQRLRSWQRSVAHVPQSIFLADSSLAENIAFGVPRDEIDLDRVREAARQAHIADFIESREEGYDAFVGERGVRLSGGQRQRIGIARALYKRASLLVFDEATSALDSETEESVMEAIEGLDRDLTILIVAHRLSTLRYCDRIYEVSGGRISLQETGISRTGVVAAGDRRLWVQ